MAGKLSNVQLKKRRRLRAEGSGIGVVNINCVHETDADRPDHTDRAGLQNHPGAVPLVDH